MKHLKTSCSTAFTMIEFLFALLILLFCFSLLSNTLHTFTYTGDTTHQDKYALYQMQLLLALSKEVEIIENELHFVYQNEPRYFIYQDEKLILKEGYQLFIQNIDSLIFQNEEGCIYVQYEKQTKKYKCIVSCK